MKVNSPDNPPQEGQRVLALYQSPDSGLREWYTANYHEGKFVASAYPYCNIIGWLPCPPTDCEIED